MHKIGKRKASEVDFWRCLMIFGLPREAQKCRKIKKMPSENRSKKRRQKRRRARPSVVRVGGHRAASRNARFLLRKAFAMISGIQFTHASTPGGVRRILFACAIPADPWDWKVQRYSGKSLSTMIMQCCDNISICQPKYKDAAAAASISTPEVWFKKQGSILTPKIWHKNKVNYWLPKFELY